MNKNLNRLLVALAAVLSVVAGVGIALLLTTPTLPKAPPAAKPPIVQVKPKGKARPEAPAAQQSSSIERQVFILQPILPTGQIYPGGGTAFLLNDTHESGLKLIVSNRHVCESAADIIAELTSGEDTDGAEFFALRQGDALYLTRRLAVSEETDLCVLEAPAEVSRYATGLTTSENEPRPQEHVVVFGHPFLRPLTRNEGLALNIFEDPMEPERLIRGIPPMRIGRMNFIILPGNSGSPLLNDQGKVAGVIFAMETASKNGLYIPVNDLKRFLRQVKEAMP